MSRWQVTHCRSQSRGTALLELHTLKGGARHQPIVWLHVHTIPSQAMLDATPAPDTCAAHRSPVLYTTDMCGVQVSGWKTGVLWWYACMTNGHNTFTQC